MKKAVAASIALLVSSSGVMAGDADKKQDSRFNIGMPPTKTDTKDKDQFNIGMPPTRADTKDKDQFNIGMPPTKKPIAR